MKIRLLLENLIIWNRKFHIYAGMFFLFFILFFSVSGLLLNHGSWEFTSFWKERRETKTETIVSLSSNRDSASLILQIMKQIKISGEISNVRLTPESLFFRVSKPGLIREVNVDMKSCLCVINEISFNLWGKIRTLHTFNGSDKEHPELRPNWFVTNTWRLAMDSVALGMIYLCISSWLMWYEIRKSYPAGMVIFVIGMVGAIFFVFILQLI